MTARDTPTDPPTLTPPDAGEIGPITRTDIVRFAGAGGDFNPVHHDEEFARAAGFPSVFAMGMLTAGLLGDFVASWLGLANVGRFAVRFASPVWPGDTLMLTVADVVQADRHSVATLNAKAGDDVRVTGVAHTRAAANDAMSNHPATPDDLKELLATPAEEVVLPIERGKVIEFARAIKSRNGLHLDPAAARAAGFADVVAPLTFSAATAHYNGGDAADLPKALGLDITRMLHGEERWSYVRPVIAGETLAGTREVVAAWRKATRSGGAMTFVLVATDYRDADDAPVLRDETVMIEMPPRRPV